MKTGKARRQVMGTREGQGAGLGAGVAAPRRTGRAPYEDETPDLDI